MAAAMLAVGAALAGCSNDALAKQYTSGDDKNYIAGSGVTEVKAADRGAPVDFSGTTASGGTFSSKSEMGDVLVVNFWWAACAPCRAEASDLTKISAEYKSKGVQFVGVNTRDSATTAQSFDAQFKVDYPSIIDADTGAVQLAFSGSMRPNATPTTFVIDKKGRIAARIDGNIDSQPSTLTTLIDSALAEGN
ncbi:TlpA family protein disulfide reductase [Rathayibacter sp. CAU 1779]